MANGDDLGFVPSAKPSDSLGFTPSRNAPPKPAAPPGLLQRVGQGLEKWWTTPTQDVAPGNVPGVEQELPSSTSPRTTFNRGAKILAAEGAPALATGAVTAPASTILGLGGATVGGALGSSGGRYLGSKVGAPTIGEDVGGLAGSFFGGMAGGGAGSSSGRRMMSRAVIDPATLEPRPYTKVVPLLGKERATALGDILDPNLPKVRSMTSAADASFQNRANELGEIGKQETLLGQENARAVQRNLQEGQAQPVSGGPGGYTGPRKPVDPVLQAVREGRASKIPTRMPPTMPPPRPARIPPLRWPQLGETPPAAGHTRIGSFDFPTTVPEAEGVPGAKGEAWSMQRTSSPELQRAVESGDPGAIETARRLNPNYRPIVIPKGASLEARPLPFTGPPQTSSGPKPFTIANAMGIRWAKTPGLPDISIPNGMAEEDIPAYVAEKQALQAKGVPSILGKGEK